MKIKVAVAIFATSLVPFAAVADEAALDGLIWRFDVVDGGAVIRAVSEEGGDAAEAIPFGEQPGRSALDELEIPEELAGHAVVEIGDGALAELDAIRAVDVPDGVRRIGERSFRDCRGLNVVRLPESVVEIGERAFSGCRSLRHIKLGNNITNMANRVFRDCRSLAAIDLPDNLASIGEKAFADCSSLHSLTIPRGVTNIAASAFADCSSLGVVVFLGAEPSLGEDVFERVDAKCLFRASSSEGWSVEIPGEWQGRKIVDLAIESYRRRTFIFLPMIVGAIGTIAILVLAIVLRERRTDDEE